MEQGAIDTSHYYTHLKNKEDFRFILFSIPVIGNIAAIYLLSKKNYNQMEGVETPPQVKFNKNDSVWNSIYSKEEISEEIEIKVKKSDQMEWLRWNAKDNWKEYATKNIVEFQRSSNGDEYRFKMQLGPDKATLIDIILTDPKMIDKIKFIKGGREGVFITSIHQTESAIKIGKVQLKG
jgi:hypothetical protein